MNQDILAMLGEVTIEAAATDEAKKGPRRFDVAAYNGGTLRLPNFPFPVVVELESLKYATAIVANLDHDRTRRIGHVTDLKNDNRSLLLSGLASAENAYRDEVTKTADNGFKWQASIEAAKDADGIVETIPAGKRVSVNGQTFTGPIHVARNFTLTGFAFCSHGADGSTQVTIAATAAGSKAKETDMEFDTWIAAKGFEPATLNDTTRAFLKQQFDADQGGGGSKKNLDDILAARKIEDVRIDAIARLAEKALEDRPGEQQVIEAMARQAEADKWTPERLELELLRTGRPQARAPRGSNRDELNGKVIEAALCMGSNLQNIEAHFDEKTLQMANDRYGSGLGLQEVLLIAAQAGGYRGRQNVGANLGEMLEYAMPPRGARANINATGFSTFSLGGILSNVGNKQIREGFMGVEQEWKKIAKIGNLKDFKTSTTYSLTGDMTYEEVGPDGQLKHAKLGEESYSNRLKTYGKIFAITRTDWVNDDMNALENIRKRLGRGGALKLVEVFWATFLNNATFFTAAKGNFDDGTDSAFDDAGLAAADLLFRLQTDADGKPLGAAPRLLVVPPQLRVAANKLMASTTTNAADNKGTDNPWAGMFEVVSSVYMANSNYTGSSAKKWYLLGDPNDLPVIEAAFLNGQQFPTIESADADFDTLGVKFRGYHDFGVALQESRGGVAMKGEA